MMKISVIYLLLVNLITFLLFAADKWKAVHHRYRIRESVLLGFSAAGGAFGGLFAMQVFRHKTQKPRFTRWIPVMLVIHAILLSYAGKMFWKV